MFAGKEEMVWTKTPYEHEGRSEHVQRRLLTIVYNNEASLLWQKPFCIQSLGFLALSGHMYPVREGLSHKSRMLLLLDNLSGAFVFLTHCN